MFSKKVYSLVTALSLLVSSAVYAAPGGDLNLTNKASLVSRTGYALTLGTQGDSDVVFRQNDKTTLVLNDSGFDFYSGGTKYWAVDSSGYFRNYATAMRIIGNDSTNRSLLLTADSNGSAAASLILYTDATQGGHGELVTGIGSSANMTIGTRSASGTLKLNTNSLTRWSVDSAGILTQDVTNGSNILFNKDGSLLGIGTTDGTDNKYMCVASGGACSRTRGAFLALNGNEVASVGGNIDISTGDGANDAVNIYNGASLSWSFNNTGTLIGAGTASIGWTVVDGTDNTACTSQCVTPAVFGFNLAAGATAPVIVGASDATADICLCAGAS